MRKNNPGNYKTGEGENNSKKNEEKKKVTKDKNRVYQCGLEKVRGPQEDLEAKAAT